MALEVGDYDEAAGCYKPLPPTEEKIIKEQIKRYDDKDDSDPTKNYETVL